MKKIAICFVGASIALLGDFTEADVLCISKAGKSRVAPACSSKEATFSGTQAPPVLEDQQDPAYRKK